MALTCISVAGDVLWLADNGSSYSGRSGPGRRVEPLRQRLFHAFGTALLVLVSWSGAAYAQHDPTAPDRKLCDLNYVNLPVHLLSKRFMWENDVGISDEDYTNGMRWERHLYPECSKNALGVFGKSAVRLHDRLSRQDFSRTTVGYAFGMNLYTPRHTEITEPILVDRPYSGWAYVSVIAAGQKGERVSKEGFGLPEIDSSVEIMVGVVGSWAQQDRVQIAFHELIEASRPMGWAHQQRGRPGVNVLYNRERHYYVRDEKVRLSWGYGGILGTVRSEANLKLALARANKSRAWQYLRTDIMFSMPNLMSSGGPTGGVDKAGGCADADYECMKNDFRDVKYWAVSLSVAPRYKAYDYFIEHESAAGKHNVDIDRGVVDVVGSFEFKRPRSQSVFAFRYVLRTQEFTSPAEHLNGNHRFLQFNWRSFFH